MQCLVISQENICLLHTGDQCELQTQPAPVSVTSGVTTWRVYQNAVVLVEMSLLGLSVVTFETRHARSCEDANVVWGMSPDVLSDWWLVLWYVHACARVAIAYKIYKLKSGSCKIDDCDKCCHPYKAAFGSLPNQPRVTAMVTAVVIRIAQLTELWPGCPRLIMCCVACVSGVMLAHSFVFNPSDAVYERV